MESSDNRREAVDSYRALVGMSSTTKLAAHNARANNGEASFTVYRTLDRRLVLRAGASCVASRRSGRSRRDRDGIRSRRRNLRMAAATAERALRDALPHRVPWRGALRHLVDVMVNHLGGPPSIGILAINVAGSFAMGRTLNISSCTAASLKLGDFLTTGVLWGFTTFSVFSSKPCLCTNAAISQLRLPTTSGRWAFRSERSFWRSRSCDY